MSTAGIAIAKSYDIDLARVFSEDFLIVPTKKLYTSYKGTPLNPGKIIFLLPLRTKRTGGEEKKMRSILVTAIDCFFVALSMPVRPVLWKILWHASGVLHR